MTSFEEFEEGWYVDAEDKVYYLDKLGNEHYLEAPKTVDEAGWYLDADDVKYYLDSSGVEYYQDAAREGGTIDANVRCIQDENDVLFFAEQPSAPDADASERIADFPLEKNSVVGSTGDENFNGANLDVKDAEASESAPVLDQERSVNSDDVQDATAGGTSGNLTGVETKAQMPRERSPSSDLGVHKAHPEKNKIPRSKSPKRPNRGDNNSSRSLSSPRSTSKTVKKMEDGSSRSLTSHLQRQSRSRSRSRTNLLDSSGSTSSDTAASRSLGSQCNSSARCGRRAGLPQSRAERYNRRNRIRANQLLAISQNGQQLSKDLEEVEQEMKDEASRSLSPPPNKNNKPGFQRSLAAPPEGKIGFASGYSMANSLAKNAVGATVQGATAAANVGYATTQVAAGATMFVAGAAVGATVGVGILAINSTVGAVSHLATAAVGVRSGPNNNNQETIARGRKCVKQPSGNRTEPSRCSAIAKTA